MTFDPHNIKLIIGLGNTGDKYTYTRHNAGFLFTDEIRSRIGDGEQVNWKEDTNLHTQIIKFTVPELILAKPTTMMNNSGMAMQAICRYYKINPAQVVVAYDDLDISLGEFKLQFGSGPKVHNGLKSIREMMGTNNFWHLRLGIENREVKGNRGIPGMTYALQRFSPTELDLFNQTLTKAAKLLTLPQN